MDLPQSAAFKVGAFVIAAIVLGVTIVAVVGAGAFGQDKVLIETYFKESVHGLSVGSPVKLRGVKVGAVEQVTLARMEYGLNFDDPERLEWGSYVVVVAGVNPEWIQRDVGMSIEEMLEHRIHDGLRAQLALEGISGLLYLEIDYSAKPGDEYAVPPWKPRHYYLPAMESQIAQWTGALGRFLDKVDDLDINRLATNLDGLLVDLRRQVNALDMTALAAELDAAVGDLRGMLATLAEGGTVENVEQTAARLESASARLDEILNGPELASALANVTATSENMRATSESLPALADSALTSLERLDLVIAQEQTDFGRLVANLRLATRDLRKLAARASEHPSGVLFGQPPPPSRPDQP